MLILFITHWGAAVGLALITRPRGPIVWAYPEGACTVATVCMIWLQRGNQVEHGELVLCYGRTLFACSVGPSLKRFIFFPSLQMRMPLCPIHELESPEMLWLEGHLGKAVHADQLLE